jgi:hypothetical protein
MNLLKIGMLNIHQDRWEDALDVFENIYIFTFSKIEREVHHNNIHYIKLNMDDYRNKLIWFIYRRIRKFESLSIISKFMIFMLRVINAQLINELDKLSFDFVHCSYSDWDDSGILSLVAKNSLKGKYVTRAYKEMRPGFNYDEIYSIKISDRIVLNDIENRNFLENKYGKDLFKGKEILTGVDEDYRRTTSILNVVHMKKLSDEDGKIHAVILSGRVFSDSRNMRSGSRLYYIPIIKELINCGIIVHLDALKIIPDVNGINQYEKLANEYPGRFIVESPTNFSLNPIKAYSVLSKYDYGILHNFIEGSNESSFDKVNIPNRFYEYQIAHVVPVIKEGQTVVLEKMFKEKNCGVIYQNVEDLMKKQCVSFFKPTFKDYIGQLYNEKV